MAKVSNLKLFKNATQSNYVATWDFNSSTKTVATSAVALGNYVAMKNGAKYYNGVTPDSWVYSKKFKIIELRGDRAVLGQSEDGQNNIMSAVNVNNLIGTAGESGGNEVATLDHFSTTWFYDIGDGFWYEGEHKDIGSSYRYSTYSPPSGTIRLNFHIIPVSQTYKVNDVDTSYWSGELSIGDYWTEVDPPAVPSTPSVELKNYTLTASIDNISDSRTDELQFEVYDGTELFTTGTATVKACYAAFQFSVNSGGSYRVRARAANIFGGSNRSYSTYSAFATKVNTIPSPPTEITTIRGASSTSVYLEWPVVNSAETYEIEYTTKLSYFDSSKETQSVSGIKLTHYEVTGLQSGDEYFFRIRATNSQGSSEWTEAKACTIGKVPSAPTTWSNSTTIIVGKPLTLYWVHNAVDGSRESYAQVEMTVDGVKETHTIESDQTNEEEDEKTYSYSVSTDLLKQGATIKWRVRTAGITKEYGAWSLMRQVDVYAPPTMKLTITNQNGDILSVLNSFPFYIKALAGPSTQMPLGYHVSITADSGYETVDSLGVPVIVNPGELVFNKYIETNDPLMLEMTAASVDFQDSINYTITVIASMNSGLTVTASSSIKVSWTDVEYPLDAEIGIDRDNYAAFITPYCRTSEGVPIEGLDLAVYRREFDGTYLKIAEGLDSAKTTVVTDPHPSLDYARYRILATDRSTGALSFYDPPAYPIQGKAIVLQWDEAWSDFEVTNIGKRMIPAWNGSLITLPYNVDVQDNNQADATLVDYVGRNYPVSYYGTKITSTSSWSTEIPKYDKDTVYALRRLAIYRGDVYVREPSGAGYWANIAVSFNQTHMELTIPITISITRVDGGV